MWTDASEVTLPVHIVADDRESQSGVVEELRLAAGVQLTVQRLAIGDYEVDQRCLFERKTFLDFANSLKDGRLFAQAHRLAAAGLPAALILEGKAGDLIGSQLRREALQGAMISLSLVFGLPILRSQDPAETARLLAYAGNQLRRAGTGAVAVHGYRPKNRRKKQLRVLQSLPGVGPKRAELLLNKFRNVQAVMNASADELSALDGFGEKRAKAIRWVLVDDPALETKPYDGLA